MASNIDLSGLDLSQPNQQPATKKSEKTAPAIDLSTVNFDLSDVDFSGIGNEKAVTEPAKEDSWGDVIYKSLAAMPERMQRSWQGIKQGVAVKGQDLTDGVLAERLRNDPSYAAELGIDPATFTAAEGDTYATKLQKNKALYAAIDKAKAAELNKDADFVAARDEGLRLSNEIAKTAPKTGDEWSAKNLVSTILTGAQDMSPAILTSILLKRPVAGLAEMTGQAYGSYYQDSIDKGLSPAEADNRATMFAALEPITEAVPLGLIMKKGATSLTDLGKSAIAEGIQESATQAIQNGYDIGVLDEDMTVGQFLNDVAFSGVTGAGVGATLHGAVQAPGMVKDWKDNRSVNNAIGDAAAESGQAVEGVDLNEYDAVRAEMGGGDVLDQMVEQASPAITEARKSAYMEARAQGMSPAEAMAASREVGEVDAMDQMVSELFDSPDSIYYANKASATNAPQSVAQMVQQQVEQGDIGPLPGETKGLPSPGQTSTIAMPGPVAQVKEATGYNPRGVAEESPVLAAVQQKLEAPALPPQVTEAVVPPPLPPQVTEAVVPPPLPQIDVAAALEPTVPAAEPAAAEVKPKSALFARTKKKAAPEVDTEALAAEEARQAELKAKGDEAVAKYVERESVRPALPGKKPPAIQVTNKILKEANERGVDVGNKVNWNGKEYTVDKFQGRAVRLIDENGNGNIVDAREINVPSVVPEGMKRVSQETKDARERYDLAPVEFEDERNLGEMVTDAQQATDDVLAQSAEVQRDLGEMIAEKEKDNAAIEGESKRVTDVEGRVGFEPVEGTDLDGKYAKDSHGDVRKITGVQGRRFVLDNGDIMIRRIGDTNVMDAPGKGDRVGMSAENRVNANTLQSLLHELNDTKRPLNKLRKNMAAMETQVPESDRHLYAPLKGRTRAAMRKELEDRMSSIAEQKESYDMSEDRGQLPKGNLIVDKRYEKDGEKMVSIIPPNRKVRIEIPESRLQSYIDKGYAKKSGGAASVKPATEKKGMSPEDVAVVATDFLKKFKGAQAINMSVMQRQEDMGIDLPEGSVLLGFYDAGNVSAKLISENLTSKEEVEALLRHEIIVHYGLRARLSKPEYDAEMDKILAADKSPALAKYFKTVREQYSDLYDMNSPDAQRMMAEEVLALAAENPNILEKSNVITRVIEALRQLMIKAKLIDGRASMESVRQLIQANAQYLRDNTVNRDDVRKSLPPMQYSAPRNFAASLKKKNDIESAEVDEDIKQGMRDTMYRDDRSLFQRIKDIMKDNGLTMEGLYQKGVDDLYTIAKYEKAGNNGELRQGKESAYKMAMLAKNVNSTVAVAMNHGAPVYKDGGISLNKNTKGFTEIFKPVLEMKGNMLPVWEYWAGAVRAQRLMKEGRENLYTEKQIKDIIDYVNRRPEMRKVFNQAHKDWREFNKAILDFGEQTGIVDPEQRKLFESDDYVPFYRVDEEVDRVTAPSGKRGLADQSSGIRRLKGGAGKMDILENMARNVNHMITSGYKNAAMQKVRDITINAALEEVPHNFKPVGISNEQMKRALTNLGLKVEGMTAEQMAQYSNLFTAVAPQGANIISVREGGKAKYYEVTDPQLLEAIAGVGPETMDAIVNILGWPKRVFTAAVTSTPNFVMTNFVRDVMGNYVQMAKATGRNDTPTIVKDVLTFRPFFKAFQGAMRSVRNDAMAVDYHVAGGMMGGYDNSRPESVAKNMRKMEKAGTIVNSPKKLWEMYEKLLTASEQATRMGVYEDVLKHTGDPVEAAYQSNDVLNFSRRGGNRLVKWLMAVTPFLNARVQGLDRMVRGGKENPKAFMLKGALLVGATMALMAMNADDERYWALPEHERDSFWIVFAGDTRYRIPKPFELGALFGTIPERAFEALYRDDRMFGNRMQFMLSNTFAADVPQFLKPVWEDQTNMNSFTQRPIVPQSLQRLEANQQYSTTTPEWIKDASKALPEAAPEWMRSPVRLQHMIEAYTGTVGQYIVGVTDVAYRKGTGTEKVAPAKKDFDYPVVKTFVRGGVSGDKYTDRLYQMSEKAGQTYGTLKAYKDQKNMQAYREFKTEKASVLSARKSIEKGVARMQKYNRQTKEIYANDNMSPEAKRAELDALQVKKNELAKELSDKYWMLF